MFELPTPAKDDFKKGDRVEGIVDGTRGVVIGFSTKNIFSFRVLRDGTKTPITTESCSWRRACEKKKDTRSSRSRKKTVTGKPSEVAALEGRMSTKYHRPSDASIEPPVLSEELRIPGTSTGTGGWLSAAWQSLKRFVIG